MALESFFQSFLAFAGGLSPGYADDIRGATVQDVQTLEQVAGVELPPTYREVLLALGRGDGGLDLGMEGSLDIEQLIDAYRLNRGRSDGESLCPPGHVLFSRYEGAEAISLTLAEPQSMWLISSKHRFSPYSDSLIGLLYRDAFTALGIQRCRHHGFIAGRHGDSQSSLVLPRVDQVAARLGYSRQGYSDSIVSCHRSDQGGMLRITQYEGEPLAINVGADTRREILRVWWAFRRAFGLAMVEWC